VVSIWIDLEGVCAEKEVRVAAAAAEEEEEEEEEEVGAEVDEDPHGGKWVLLDTNVCILLIINWIESKYRHC
jgi:ribosomal silencing factor RsfS